MGTPIERVSFGSLSDFEPESDLSPMKPSKVAGSPPVKSLSVAELMAKSPSLEWYEAVAICQALCDTLQMSGVADAPLRLDPTRVAIDASGSVYVGSVEGGNRAVDEVVNLLRILLPQENVPTPLRLAMSQSSTVQSVDEWSRSIGYYERPNRALVIRTVYQRAAPAAAADIPELARLAQTSVPSSVAVSAAPLTAPMESQPLSAQTELPRPETRRGTDPAIRRILARIQKRHIAVAIGATAVLLLLTAVMSLVQGNRVKGNAAASAGNAAASAASAASAAPADVPRSEGSVSLNKALNTAASMMGSLASRLPILGGEATKRDEPMAEIRTGRWIYLPADRVRLATPASLVMPVQRSVPILMPAAEGGEEALPELASINVIATKPSITRAIYSADDDDVIPPVAVYPQFPTMFPPGITQNDFAEFEVVVLPTGSVESVRARRVPVTMAEAVRVTMSLSAAKSWRFRPGLKDGEPIKYRQVIRVLKN